MAQGMTANEVNGAGKTSAQVMFDLSMPPSIPDGLRIAFNATHGAVAWSPQAFSLYLDPMQKRAGALDGIALHKRLSALGTACGARVLDCLLIAQECIPDEWKKLDVYFRGTLYTDDGGRMCVRYLCYGQNAGWHSLLHWLRPRGGGGIRSPMLVFTPRK